MNKDNFFRKSFLLTLSNLTTGILGLIFMITLSKELGPEGVGIYRLVMPIFSLVICLICGGILIAISKLSAEYSGKKDYINLHKTISATLKLNLLWGAFILIIFYFFSGYIGTYIIKDIRTINALKILSPAMFFIAISNTLKGYFYGVSKIFIPAIIDVFEKAMRIVVFIFLINLFGKDSIEKTVTIAYFSLLIGEFVSLLLLYIYYKLDKNKIDVKDMEPISTKQIIFSVLVIALPLCLNGLIGDVFSSISTLIVPRRLVFSGMEYSEAMATIGKFIGMALNIVFFPFVIIGSICTLLIPDLSASISKKNYHNAERRISQIIKISYLLGFSIFIIAKTIPDELGLIIFNRNDLGEYISFLSITAPIVSTSAVTYAILNGIGKQKIILRNSILMSIFEIIFLYILLGNPYLNIYGFGISLMLTSTMSLILNCYEISKNFKIAISLFTFLFDSLTCILVFYILKIVTMFMPNSLNLFKMILVMLVSFTTIFALFYIKKSNKSIQPQL